MRLGDSDRIGCFGGDRLTALCERKRRVKIPYSFVEDMKPSEQS
jgi:hypothetical protein